MGADYTPEITSGFKALFGAYTGISVLKYQGDWSDVNGAGAVTASGTDKDSLNDRIIGAKAGGIYEINANNEIEFGYKFDRTDYGKSSKIDILA